MNVLRGISALVVALCTTSLTFADDIRQVPLQNGGLVYDCVSGLLFASVPSSGGTRANSITAIDPIAGTLGTSVFMGSEPAKLAISDDSEYIYAGLDGAAAVRRYHIPTATAGLQFSLGSSATTGPFFVEDMEVLPGNHDAVAVSRRNVGFSPRHEGVAIYSNGVAPPNVTANHTGSNVIAFSNTSSRLYGYNTETSESGFRRMDVNASGVTTISTTGNLITGSADIEYSAGRIFATSGRVINPEALTIAGTFPVSGLVEPDAAAGRVFFLSGTGTTRSLVAMDPNTFAQVGSPLSIPGVNGTAFDLVRWGSNGLAFRTTSSQIFLIRSDLVPEPGTIVLLTIGAMCGLRRRRCAAQ